MAVIDRLRALAAGTTAPVFVAAGPGADPVLAHLRADPGIEVVTSPRHATVLVTAGALPADWAGSLRLVHDQVPAPRATVVAGSLPAAVELPVLDHVDPDDPVQLVEVVRRQHAAVVAGEGDRSTLGPLDSPVAWQGVGPHGQGGEGMMGGTPYGRPMPMPPTPGRDGLALDRLSLRLGPFLVGLPPGLVIDVGLQGDVLETVEVSVVAPPTPPAGSSAVGTNPVGGSPWLPALAELLAMVGLPALARRTARLAVGGPPTTADVAALRERLDSPWALRPATDGVGHLALDRLGGDVTARWRRWLQLTIEGGDRGPTPVPADVVSEQLVGMEVGQAMLTLASLRPELSAATAPVGAT